jgi:hypothetical protein
MSFNIITELCHRLASDCQLKEQPQLEWQPPDAADVGSIAGLLITLPDASRIILVERTYRDGTYGVLDATDEHVAAFHRGDLWAVWNDKAAQPVRMATPSEEL